MIISYAYTTEALLAGRKTCTRRDWKDDYARRFREGQVHQAWDRSPRVRGKQVGNVLLTITPYKSDEYPEEDYEAEGLKYMEEKGMMVPLPSGPVHPREFWEEWIRRRPLLWVVRFKLLSTEDAQ